MDGSMMLASTSAGTIKRRKVRTKMIPLPLGATFAAIDFETANRSRDSACAVSVVSVVDGVVDSVFTSLICPPSPIFEFTAIHAISYADVKNSPSFEEIYQALRPILGGAPFIAAHNAAFDSSVLAASCELIGEHFTTPPWLCTVRLARRTWRLPRCGLDRVSEHLGISLNHHNAESDARACAGIVVAALGVVA
jgi:DNA polymerase-3 subunit epsilon